MKSIIKTISWMTFSGILVFISGMMHGSMIQTAIFTAISSVVLKMPFYYIHENVFEKLWNKGKIGK